jgi:hypothetical protein
MEDAAIDEEISTLRLTFGEDSVEFTKETRKLRLYLPNREEELALVLDGCIPSGYPNATPLSASCLKVEANWLAPEELEKFWQSVPEELVSKELSATAASHRSEGTLCALAFWLYEARQRTLKDPSNHCREEFRRDHVLQAPNRDSVLSEESCGGVSGPPDERNAASQAGPSSGNDLETTLAAEQRLERKPQNEQQPHARICGDPLVLVSVDPFTERKSTFQGHAAFVVSWTAVEHCLQTLREHSKGRTATHMIWACRIARPGSSVQEGTDDDGERRGGRLLLELLRKKHLTNVFVCVCRWFGGTLLYGRRFYCIQLAAKQALAALEAANPAPQG